MGSVIIFRPVCGQKPMVTAPDGKKSFISFHQSNFMLSFHGKCCRIVITSVKKGMEIKEHREPIEEPPKGIEEIKQIIDFNPRK